MTLYDLLVSISIDTSKYDEGMDKAESKTKTFGEKVKGGFGKIAKIGAAAVGAASASVLAFGASSVKTGMDFDKSMSQVAATLGKTTDEIKDLRDFAQEMGSKTAFSATQAADALNYMALAGYDSEKSMKMLPNVLNLAAAGGMELATASDMVTDASSALGLSIEETQAMVDQMAQASSKSNTSVEQLGQAMLTVGGTAKSLKGGTTELATALGILADNGTKGAEGGTALRNILTSIQGSKFEKTFGEMGISAYDAQGNLRNLKDVFQDMDKAMDGMTTEEKTNLINNTFNARDLKNVNALLGTSADRWDELSAAIDDSAGAAQKMADTQLDNLAGDITLMKSAVEGAQIAISDNLSPAFRSFVQEGTKGIQEFSDLLKSGDFSGAMESVGGTIANIATIAISKIPTLISAGGDLLKGMIKGFSTQIPALIASGMDAVTQFGDGLVQGIPDMLSRALPALLSLTDRLKENAGKFIDAGLNFITNLAQGIINSIPLLISYLPQIITNIANIINENAPKVLLAGINIIKNLALGLISAIPTLVSHIPQIIQAIWSVFLAVNWINIGANIITFIGNGIRNLATAIPNTLQNIFNTAVEWIGAINWSTLGADIIDLLVIGAKSVASALPNVLMSIGRTAIAFFKSVNWASVGRTVITLLSAAVKGAGSLVWNGLKTIGKKAIETFKSIDWKGVGKTAITFIGNAIKGAGGLVLTALKTAGSKALQGFKSINWVSLGTNIISGIIRGISGAAGSLFNKLKGIASNALGAAKKALKIESPSKVFEQEVGKNIILGWAKGITENAPKVESALADVNNGMYDAFASMGEIPITQDVSVSASPLDVESGSPLGSKVINFAPQVTVNGAEDPEDWANRFVRQLRQEVRMA